VDHLPCFEECRLSSSGHYAGDDNAQLRFALSCKKSVKNIGIGSGAE
jgi:hypothetical protein